MTHACTSNLHPNSSRLRKFLGFVLGDQVYALKTAPQVQTNIFQVVVLHLHSLEILVNSYLDDYFKEYFPGTNWLSFTIDNTRFAQLCYFPFFLFQYHYQTDQGILFPPELKKCSLSCLSSPAEDSYFLNGLGLGRLYIRPCQLYLI